MITVPSTTTATSNPINVSYNTKIGCDHTSANASNPTRTVTPNNPAPPINPLNPSSFGNISSHLFSSSTSSSTASDDEFARQSKRKRKRKWKQFFKRLTREVMEKQEELQKKFLETIEKREHERVVREEAWRIQEMARINREHEILIQERSNAAVKDAAVISFLQKVSGQQRQQQQQQLSFGCVEMGNAYLGRDTITIQRPEVSQKPPPSLPPPPPPPPRLPQLQTQPLPLTVVNLDSVNGDNVVVSSSSRWPKAEVRALIRLRTNLDMKYQETLPKGPSWEAISAAMRKVGYNRNAKRCKEKWENINKYFKKVKESNKQRPEDSKTCPYFHLLDALHKEKNKINNNNNNGVNNKPIIDSLMEPLMVQPEQQWPPAQQGQGNNNHMQTVIMEDMEKENLEGEDSHGDEEEEEEEEDDDDDEGGGDYEIVANNNKLVPLDTTHE